MRGEGWGVRGWGGGEFNWGEFKCPLTEVQSVSPLNL